MLYMSRSYFCAFSHRLGPWFVGEIMSDYIGLVCVWGIYVKGAFLPGSLTFFYGIFQVRIITLTFVY